jgi:hypothetical protein
LLVANNFPRTSLRVGSLDLAFRPGLTMTLDYKSITSRLTFTNLTIPRLSLDMFRFLVGPQMRLNFEIAKGKTD